MARVTMPLLSQDARGSVSGIQFSRNRSGNFGSRKSTSNHKQGDVAINHRTLIKAAHSAWEDLSTALKANWEAYAPIPLTGRNAFMGATIRNLTIGKAPPAESPLLGPHSTPIKGLFWKFAPPQPQSLIWDPQAQNNDLIIAYMSIPFGPSASTPHVRKFKYFFATSTIASPLNFYPEYPVAWLAARVIHWDYTRGIPLSEWRGSFSTSEDFVFDSKAI